MDPFRGDVAAKEAYTEPRFLTWRRYAEGSGLPWFVLSTKYGLLQPSDLIEAYDRGIREARADSMLHAVLSRQGRELGLAVCQEIELLDYEVFLPLVRAAVGKGPTITVKRLTTSGPARW